jgi:hypothetical protein
MRKPTKKYTRKEARNGIVDKHGKKKGGREEESNPRE